MEEDESLSLSNFVEQFSTLLPLQITVKKGYHGSDERHSVAADDVYNVHFVKRTKVVVLQEGRDVTFTVPLNSVVKFAPVFNPNDDPEEAMRGFTFERVSDIMAQKTLPKIVRALKPHVKVDPVSTIEQNEMFVVQKVVLVGMRKKALQVFSVMRGEEKLLPSDSVGGFTTEPQLTCIYLPEIINRFLSDFPLDVLVVMNDGGLNQDIPYYLTTEISRLTGVDSETSLIVSTSWGQNEKVSDEDQMPIDIPVDLPIEVAVCQPDDGKESDLSRSTKKLFERFDPCNIRSLRGRSVRRGFEKEGTELQRPDRIYDIPAVRQTRRNLNQPLSIPTNKASSSKHSREENGSTHPVPKPRSHSTKQGQCHMYEPLVIQTQLQPNPKLQYAVPEQHSPVKTNTVHSSADSNDPLGAGGSAGVTPASAAGRRRSKLSPLSSAELAGLASERGPDMKLMAARVEALEREVYALRSEMAKLRAQSMHRNFIFTQHAIVSIVGYSCLFITRTHVLYTSLLILLYIMSSLQFHQLAMVPEPEE